MFSLYDEAINTDRFIDFLQKVIESSDKKDLKHNTRNYMESLQKNSQEVANFFQYEAVKYVA